MLYGKTYDRQNLAAFELEECGLRGSARRLRLSRWAMRNRQDIRLDIPDSWFILGDIQQRNQKRGQGNGKDSAGLKMDLDLSVRSVMLLIKYITSTLRVVVIEVPMFDYVSRAGIGSRMYVFVRRQRNEEHCNCCPQRDYRICKSHFPHNA